LVWRAPLAQSLELHTHDKILHLDDHSQRPAGKAKDEYKRTYKKVLKKQKKKKEKIN
jgi:hypothetical protein